MNKWIKIDDEKILHLWQCADCNETRYVYPWFYSEMGEPCCEGCDGDMEYIHTEMEVDNG